MQPVVTGMVTVHRVTESNTAGWPCTLFRVVHVGAETAGHGAEGGDNEIPIPPPPSARLLPSPAPMLVDLAFAPGGEWN